MKDNGNDSTQRQRLEAMFEGKISAEDLVKEIEPLIEDYFVGDFTITQEGLELKFLNGQTFILSVSEKVNRNGADF